MKYIVAQEIKSETKVGKNIYLFDLFFVLVYFCISFVLGMAVHEKLRILFYIFSFAAAFFLTAKSRLNRRRRNIESILLFFRKDSDVYYPVLNISKAGGRKDG